MTALLLELLTEEIPAGMQETGAQALEREVMKRLEEAGLKAESSRCLWTPRRTSVIARGLPAETPPRNEERRGPRVSAPEKALEGFLRSAGVDRDSLETRGEGEAAAWYAVISHPAVSLESHLAEAVPDALRAVRWPKSMRWREGGLRWARPIRSLLCVVEDDQGCRPVSIKLDEIESSGFTRGHPVLASDWYEVKSVDSYEKDLRQAYVIADAGDRRKSIAESLDQIAQETGLEAVTDPLLLEENANLVEWPVTLRGAIDSRHLVLPDPILRTSMRTHQRFFALRGESGVVGFAAVADNEGSDGGDAMRRGFERVLRARLEDARYFWQRDLTRGLPSMTERLASITHHADLGTVADRALRLERIAGGLADVFGADRSLVQEAAKLAKADLVSETVSEFPSLQGTAGGLLAAHAGANAEVAEAVAQQYRPAGPADAAPTRPVAATLAIADRCELLFGMFAAGIRPKGSGDPFALRRAALGLMRILIETGRGISLEYLFGLAGEAFTGTDLPQANSAAMELRDFALERLRVHLRDKGCGHEAVAAILDDHREDDPVRATGRVEALERFLKNEAEAEDLLTAYRRCRSILLSEESADSHVTVDAGLFQQEEERALGKEIDRCRGEAGTAMEEDRFDDALRALSSMRAPVDSFFDHVTVNAEDESLRANRLALIAEAVVSMEQVAGFDKIGG